MQKWSRASNPLLLLFYRGGLLYITIGKEKKSCTSFDAFYVTYQLIFLFSGEMRMSCQGQRRLWPIVVTVPSPLSLDIIRIYISNFFHIFNVKYKFACDCNVYVILTLILTLNQQQHILLLYVQFYFLIVSNFINITLSPPSNSKSPREQTKFQIDVL